MTHRFSRLNLPAALTSLALSAVLTGCGMGSTSTSAIDVNAHAAGTVFGGQQPVTGSHIALYAASTTAYGATVTPLATGTTDGSGSFQLTSSYTCPANSQAYVVATGGNPGLSGTVDNSAVFLMAALGPCASAATSTVNINEVTTIAAAYALSGFLPAGGAGLTEANVVAGTAMAGVATSPTNTIGLTDAFANANNIVNFTTGLAYTATPATGSTGVVPQSVIHELANILQPCVNSESSTSSTCASLFAAATPPSGTGIAAPANVLQAAINIAQYPANNAATLFGLVSTSPAFASTMTAAPTDWTIGVTYTNTATPVMVSTSGLGIDNNDDIYIAGTGYLINFTNQGAPINSTNLLTGVNAGDALRYMAFDSSNNLFIADGAATTFAGLYELTSGGSTVPLTYGATADPNTYGVAVDALGDAFTMSYSKSSCSSVAGGCTLYEFPKGNGYTPVSTYSGLTVSQPTGGPGSARGVAFDVNTGNIWLTSIDDNLGELFTVTPSTTGAATASTTNNPKQLTNLGAAVTSGQDANDTSYGTISVAVDKNANGWFLTSGGAAVTGSKATTAVIASITPVSSTGVVGTNIPNGYLTTPGQVIVDGNDNLFISNEGGNAIAEYNTTLGAFATGTSSTIATPPAGGAGFVPSGVTLYQPQYLEVDRAGALWTSNSGSGSASKPSSLIQILGVAAPTNPVQSAGQYGVKP